MSTLKTYNVDTGDTTSLVLKTNGTSAVTVDSSQNVGIGTSSPDALLTVNTVASFGDGAAATPSVAHKGDLNTGLWFPAADTIAASTAGTEQMRIDSSGNLKFDSGYGSVATAYGCRAWVNFDGTASGTFAGGTSTVSRTSGSTTATVTTTNDHGLITGNNVWALTGVAAGSYTVTVTGAKTFTITTVATTTLTNASITFAVNSISGSGNISSIADNGTGIFTANFATAMPDANYSTNVSGCNQGDAAGRNTTATIRSGVYSTTQVGMMLYDGSNTDRAITCLAVYR